MTRYATRRSGRNTNAATSPITRTRASHRLVPCAKYTKFAHHGADWNSCPSSLIVCPVALCSDWNWSMCTKPRPSPTGAYSRTNATMNVPAAISPPVSSSDHRRNSTATR